MIEHLAPRCVRVVSSKDSEKYETAVELDTVLSADVCIKAAGEAHLVLRLTTGQTIIAAQYGLIAEAWRDYGRLCLLAGIERNCGEELPRLSALAASSAQRDASGPRGELARLRRWFGIGRSATTTS